MQKKLWLYSPAFSQLLGEARPTSSYDGLSDPHEVYFVYSVNRLAQLVESGLYALTEKGALIEAATNRKVRDIPDLTLSNVQRRLEQLQLRRLKKLQSSNKQNQLPLKKCRSRLISQTKQDKLSMYCQMPFRVRKSQANHALPSLKKKSMSSSSMAKFHRALTTTSTVQD